MKAHSGLCQQDKLAQPRPERNRMTRERSRTGFPKVLEFLFLLEGWAVNDEMVLFTMETTRLRGDLVRSQF